MDPNITVDAVRFAHLLSVAVGLGTSFLADTMVIAQMDKPVDQPLLDRLKHCHHIVIAALIPMWLTGIALIYIRTGFVIEEFSPKLFSKLAVVSILTLNAYLIGKFAMPLLERNLKRSLLDMPTPRKFVCAWVSAVSTTSWILALAMGESKVLAASGWSVFTQLVPLAYLLSVTIATLVVILLQSYEGPVRPHQMPKLVLR